eukprot:COSAG01_NODE_6991_length_3401_cov_3.070000_2_plen_80_part_00
MRKHPTDTAYSALRHEGLGLTLADPTLIDTISRRDHFPNGIVKKLAECINEHSNTAHVQMHDSLTQEPPIVCHFGERQV